MERPKCPHCERPLERVGARWVGVSWEFTLDGNDWEREMPEWTQDGGYRCPDCGKEIPDSLAEEVFAYNEEEAE